MTRGLHVHQQDDIYWQVLAIVLLVTLVAPSAYFFELAKATCLDLFFEN
jgi:hypothetical protein